MARQLGLSPATVRTLACRSRQTHGGREMGSRSSLPRKAVVWGLVGIVGAVLGVVACGGSSQEPADTVFRGGYVYTVDGRDSVQQAIAVKDGKIVYVGSESGVSDHLGSRTRVELPSTPT
jgi:hypothetical protein